MTTPDMQMLDAKLETQRERLVQAMGVVGTVSLALRTGGSPINGHINQNDSYSARVALDGAYELLDRVAGRLESGETLLEVHDLDLEKAIFPGETAKGKSRSAAGAVHAGSEPKTLYDRLVYETCTLECVLKVLENVPDGDCQSGVPAAELVLRRSIDTLSDISSDVENLAALIVELRGVAGVQS